MKLKVTKRNDGTFEFELMVATDKKPMKATIDAQRLDMLVQMLAVAKRADAFAFVLEL